ncbi:MAG: hypothetical protein DSO07_12770 [Thermoproteota archaeon]|jgi:hypothetical protein|uniref:Uncharacterized protein n=2 Tax=Candidatus Korarchaeia TaxID=3342163 RepID=A0A3R9R4C5_9CREN|nr:hypothetical protein D6D85_08160 [Candidatus Methanodesulfokores washburnensis]RZN59550.1 MAG: hypothetical protein EF810_06655 [Candidatus Methanodesulfokores washburnensis]TDA37304.1 MAG: hypothetical protein DSO07_12770 [Candidatus Korarchaeota archaeon]
MNFKRILGTDEYMRSIVAKISEYLGLSTEEVERRALRHLILDELRRVKAEKVLILSKYGVRSFEDLMRLVEEDKVSDVDAHDDMIRLDYLEDREKELENLLEELEGQTHRHMGNNE